MSSDIEYEERLLWCEAVGCSKERPTKCLSLYHTMGYDSVTGPGERPINICFGCLKKAMGLNVPRGEVVTEDM